MAGLYSAGEVGIDVVPVVDRFFRELDAKLRARHYEFDVPVNFDPDDANAKRTLKEWQGRSATVNVRYEQDGRGLQQLAKQDEQLRKQLNKPITVAVDDSDLGRRLDNMRLYRKQMRDIASGVSNVRFGAFGGDKVSDIRRAQIEVSKLADKYDSLAKDYTELSDMRREESANLDKQIAANGRTLDGLRKKYDELGGSINECRLRRDAYRKAGDRDNWNRERDNLKNLNAEYKACRENIRRVTAETERLTRKQASLRNDSIAKWLKKLDGQANSAAAALDKATKGLNELHREDSRATGRTAGGQASILSDMSAMGKDWARQADSYAKAQERAAKATSLTDQMAKDLYGRFVDLGEVTRANARSLAGYNSNLKSGSRTMGEYRRRAAEANRILDEQERYLVDAQDAMQRYNKYGAHTGLNKRINDDLASIRRLRKELVSNPLKASIALDDSKLNRDYAALSRRIDRLANKLSKEYEVDVRVKVWEDEADRLERRLNRLRHERIDIPVDFQADEESIIRRMRDTAELIKANPERRVELEADLDLDMKRAEEKLKKFQDKNDELKMDLDLKSKLASAHLAMLTRPRTVDIYAKLHATEFGKLIDGMTYGATGLRGLNNQFERLTNLFDTLDRKVPFFTTFATAFSGLAAGAVNASGSILGVGASIVSMSKAALAAPAALVGLGAAYASVRMIWGDKGDTWSENIDIATTKLGKMSDMVVKSFYGEARPAIRSLADEIGDDLNGKMATLAKHEGEVVAGMTRMVGASSKAGEVDRIFDDVNQSIENLVPGTNSLVDAFLRLGDGTSQYLPRAASYMGELTARFSEWVDTSRMSGSIVQSMQDVVEQAGYLKDTFNAATGIAGGLYSALAEDQNGIQSFAEVTQRAAETVKGARFQDTLKEWTLGARDAKTEMRDTFSDIGESAYSLRSTTADVFRDAGSTMSSFTSNVSRLLENSSKGISDFSSGASSGFRKVFDAVGDTSPAFDQLLSTVGKLSDTFGGTLASSMKAAAPIITTMGKTAETVADIWASLPEPIQATIGLYATFGKAGANAWNTLKASMLENVVQMAQYKAALAELGIAANGTNISMSKAFAGMLKESATFGPLVTNVTNAEGAMAKLKAGATGLGGLLASTLANPTTWGIAAITAAIAVYADYNQKAQATQKASEDIASALAKIPDSAKSAADGITSVGKAVETAFNDKDYGETGLKWFDDWITGFDSAKDAADHLGLSTKDLANAVTSGGGAYDSLRDKLQKTAEAGTTMSSVMGYAKPIYTDDAKAAMKLQDALETANKQYRTQTELLAQTNGYSKEYADKLLDAGASSDALSVSLATQTQREEMLSKARQQAIDWTQKQHDAQKNLLNTQSDYAETYQGMSDAINRINAAVGDSADTAKKTALVWDGTAKATNGLNGSFNTMNEYGRLAQQSLDNLGNSGHSLIEAMVSSGASIDDVKAKQSELADQFVKTAESMGVPEQAAKQLQNIYGLTPTEVTTLFKAKAEQAKSTLTQYLSNLRALFPGAGNDAIFTTVLQGINSGALASVDDVYNEVQKLTGKDYVTVITGDNKQFRISKDEAEQMGIDLTKSGPYKVTLDADDLASGKIKQVIAIYNTGLGLKPMHLLMNADGDALWKTQNVEKNLETLGMSQKTYEWLLNGNGTAEERMNAVRDALKGLDLSDKQIQWILDCIDKASGKVDSVEKKKRAAATGIKFSIDADDNATPKIELASANGEALADRTFTSRLDADPARFNANVMLANATQLAPHTSTLNGNANPFNGVVMAVNATQLAPHTSSINGNANPFWGTVNSIPYTVRHNVIDVSATDTWSRSLPAEGATVRTVWVDVKKRGDGSVRVATGGRINGPGTATSDSIPAWLSNGEAVLKASSLRKLDMKYGQGFFDYLNAHGELPSNLRALYANVSKTADATAAYSRQGAAYSRGIARNAYASGGRVRNAANDCTIEINPIIETKAGTTVNQTFNTKIVRSNQDLYQAAPILHRNAIAEARRYT